MTDPHRQARMATSFGREAASYSKGRPDYPEAAIAHLVPSDARVVVDIGAGTGKLTASLLSPGRTEMPPRTHGRTGQPGRRFRVPDQ